MRQDHHVALRKAATDYLSASAKKPAKSKNDLLLDEECEKLLAMFADSVDDDN